MSTGMIRKMRTQLDSPVSYSLPVDDDEIDMNALIGQSLRLEYVGEIHCVSCGRTTSKSYAQGHCYPCFRDLAECDMCIMKPETCHFDKGTCREPEWAQAHCMQPHYVYLANSSGLKVGITRGSQLPTRWIDQGASQALPIFRVDSRYQSGLLEVLFKKQVSDRTDWRKMLKASPDAVDLEQERDRLLELCQSGVAALRERFGDSAIEYLPEAEGVEIDYPVVRYPEKVRSLNFDKQPQIEGVLDGIKGQYLILDSGVLNIRKFSGYTIEVKV